MYCRSPAGWRPEANAFALRCRDSGLTRTRTREGTVRYPRLPRRSVTALLALAVVPDASAATTFNVRDFGAKGEGTTNDTSAINDAIEAASATGDGIVQFP